MPYAWPANTGVLVQKLHSKAYRNRNFDQRICQRSVMKVYIVFGEKILKGNQRHSGEYQYLVDSCVEAYTLTE